tara:strand:+ start:356 stop:553 length:198 start_codon:yes stop_codon:yes gene_type:complete
MKMMVVTYANSGGTRVGRVTINPMDVSRIMAGGKSGSHIVFTNGGTIEVAQSHDLVTSLWEKAVE